MRVVHNKREAYTHYIGRPSLLGNPFSDKSSRFHTESVSSRAEAIKKFEEYARKSPEILWAIYQLPKDAILGCWCKPLPCHGDVIITLWKELHTE